MTLIAAFYINNHPVLIGDVLITCPDHSKHINIPTDEDLKESPPEDLYRGITELSQKVNVITSNLMVAWSGNQWAASTILKELKTLSDVEKITRYSLKNFFENSKISEWIGNLCVGFIGYIIDDDGIKEFEYSFNEAEIHQKTIQTYGSVFIAGSGSADLIRLLEEGVQPRKTSISEFDDAVIHSLTICGALLAKDCQNILSYYGGSFEIATLNKQRIFEKVNDITYFHWFVSNCESSNPKLDLVGKAYKLTYINDLLVVFTLSMGQTPMSLNRDSVPLNYFTEFHIDEWRHYVIPPCYKYFKKNEIDSLVSGVPIEITSSFNCNHLFPVEQNQSGDISFVPGKNIICKPQFFSEKDISYIVECPNYSPSTLIIRNEDLDYLRNSYNF